MKKVSEAHYLRIAGECMTDERLLPVTIHIKEAWMLVTTLQLATRHPKFPASMRTAVIDIARQFQRSIEELHPEAQELLEQGWNQRFDRR